MDRLSPLSYDSGCDSLSFSPKKPDLRLLVSDRSTCSPAKAVDSDEAALPESSALLVCITRKRKNTSDNGNNQTNIKKAVLELAEEGVTCSYLKQNFGDIDSARAGTSSSSSSCCDSVAYSVSISGSHDCDIIKKEELELQAVSTQSTSTDSGIPSPDWASASTSTQEHEDVVSEDDKTIKSKSPVLRKNLDDEGNWVITEEAQEDFTCYWKNCNLEFDAYDNLYDHMIEKHVDEVRLMEPTVVPSIVACEFGKCKMSVSRGDREKKYKWLLEHIRTRHSGTARVFKCLIEGCTERFRCMSKVESHVRNQHIASPKKIKELSNNEKAPESWYGWKKLIRPKPRTGGLRFLWTPYYDRKLQEQFLTLQSFNFQFEMIPYRRPGIGAAHRKAYGRYAYQIVPSKKEQKMVEPIDNSFIPVRNFLDNVVMRDMEHDDECDSAYADSDADSNSDVDDDSCLDTDHTDHSSDDDSDDNNSSKESDAEEEDCDVNDRSVHDETEEQSSIDEGIRNENDAHNLEKRMPQRIFGPRAPPRSFTRKDNTTLDDLFPGWNFEEKKPMLLAAHSIKLEPDLYGAGFRKVNVSSDEDDEFDDDEDDEEVEEEEEMDVDDDHVSTTSSSSYNRSVAMMPL